MWSAPGTEPVREPEEVFLVDGVEHRDSGALDDLVFQGGHTPIELHFAPVSLWARLKLRIRFIPCGASGLSS